MDNENLCECCGGTAEGPAVPVTYRVGGELHDGSLLLCEACIEAGQDEAREGARGGMG